MRIERFSFRRDELNGWKDATGRNTNWPVVYALNDEREVYVGETVNAVGRLRQHLANTEKQHLKAVRVVFDETFNKSVCLDLESYLISLFAGDGQLKPLNRNDGITNADYYDRARYRELFAEIFEALRADNLFTKTIDQIRNSDLFKLSPFKALNQDQEVALVDILNGVFEDLATDTNNTVVVNGGPGTGKTIVAIFLIKLLADIATTEPSDDAGIDSVFSDFFVEDNREALKNFRMGLVVPQQSLRKSIEKVFEKVPGLHPSMVLSPIRLAKSQEHYDLLVVDEAHRLGRYGSSMNMADFGAASQGLALPDEDWRELTQLDWIRRLSSQQILFMDRRQTIRPLDLPKATVDQLLATAREQRRSYLLTSQMRVAAGSDYLSYIDEVLDGGRFTEPRNFEGYDLQFYDSARAMREAIVERDREEGLARVVAGFAWKWVSKRNRDQPDIRLEGLELFWNRTAVDWINSPTSLEEVGSIHTVQGYDLNYAGVIIGPELRWDRNAQRIVVDRASYWDIAGKKSSKILGVELDDAALLELVKNVYRVLLTRGMRGTYVYVADPALRERLRPFFARV